MSPEVFQAAGVAGIAAAASLFTLLVDRLAMPFIRPVLDKKRLKFEVTLRREEHLQQMREKIYIEALEWLQLVRAAIDTKENIPPMLADENPLFRGHMALYASRDFAETWNLALRHAPFGAHASELPPDAEPWKEFNEIYDKLFKLARKDTGLPSWDGDPS